MIRYSHITPSSQVDGPGTRTVLFLQGCPIACKGCQNKALWDARGGFVADEKELAKWLVNAGNPNITISGGEPTEQLESLFELIDWIKIFFEAHLNAEAHIIVYTGRTYEWLIENKLFGIMNIIRKIDVLVDGPFVKELDDPFITWRGSRNQRPIDCKATLETGQLVTLDWSKSEIVINEDGTLVLPAGVADDLKDMGEVKKTRMCGQTKPVRTLTTE